VIYNMHELLTRVIKFSGLNSRTNAALNMHLWRENITQTGRFEETEDSDDV